MIEAKQLTKVFGTGEQAVRAVKEVDLQIESGEMVSIMGPSGCGKTTLLQVMSGIDEPTAGEVVIEGFTVYGVSEAKRAAFRLSKTGFIFQSFHLIPVLSALENVALPLIGQGVPVRQAHKQAKEVLALVGLEAKGNAFPTQLSGGQNQRVAIARAIVAKPAVIWADEPTGALDSETSQQVVGLLRHINRTLGTTMVIVTHDPHVAAQTDRIIQMENGRILASDKQVSL